MNKKRGVAAKHTITLSWSPNFAYAIGLIATDGCVSSNGYHISFGSKDYEQVVTFARCLRINNKIGVNVSGNKLNTSYRVQFGDINFSRFLKTIGIGPAKSKTITSVRVPRNFFFDFVRGCFDGDGSIYMYQDPRWPTSFLAYISFSSASTKYISWLRSQLFTYLRIRGHISTNKTGSVYQLKYAKREAAVLARHLYKNPSAPSLKRKRLKIIKMLGIVAQEKRSR